MFGSTDVWGIAFGTTDLRAVKMSRSGNGIQVLEAEVLPYAQAPGVEGEEADRDQQIRQTLQALSARHRIRRETVAISVPGNAVFSKFITLPPVERKRVPEIVKYESRQQIPFPIEEVVWDYQLVKPEPVPGEDIEVALFAMRREIIQGHLAACLAAGLKPRLIQAAPLAFCNFLRYDQPPEGALVILDVGQDSTEVLILDGERCWPRSLGVGSQDLSAALQQKFQISPQKAEELKIQAVKSRQADRLFGVMKPVLQNLSGQVQRTLGFYKSQHADVRFEKVCLVGDFFEIPGVEAYFKESLRYGFVRMAAPRRISVDEGVQDFAAKAPLLAVPMGLGLQALGVASVRTNLVPPENLQQERQVARRPWAIAAVLLVGGAVSMAALRARQDLGTLDQVIQEATSEIKTKDKNKEDFKAAEARLPDLDKPLKRMPGMLKDPRTGLPSVVYPDVLRKVLEAVPPNGIWVDAIDIRPVALSTTHAWMHRPWARALPGPHVLKVDVSAHRLTPKDTPTTDVLDYVREGFEGKIRELALDSKGSDGKPVLFAGKEAEGSFARSPQKEGENSPLRRDVPPSQDCFSFHVIWYVNPEYYEARTAPSPGGAP